MCERIPGRCVAFIRIVRGELGDDGVQFLRRANQPCDRRRGGFVLGDLREMLRGIPLKKTTSGRELPHHDAQRVQVHPSVAGDPIRDFRRDIPRLREHDAGDGVASAVLASCGTEVDQFHVAAVADHDVLRAHVPVNDSERGAANIDSFVDVGERFRSGGTEGDGLRPGHAVGNLQGASANLAKAPSFHIFHDHEGFSLLVIGGLDDLHDPRMMQLRLNTGFVEKSSEKRTVLGVLSPDDLDHTGAFSTLDSSGGGQVDLAHATACDQSEQPVSTEPAGLSELR